MANPLTTLSEIFSTTIQYWACLLSFVFLSTPYSQCTYFVNDPHAKVQIFSLSLIIKLWSQRHYRSESFQQDMLDNLKNVAIPGTGIPISFFCHSQFTVLFGLFVVNPIICLLGAINKVRKQSPHVLINEQNCDALKSYYIQHLLHPDDWFSLWRMNCRLVSYHSLITQSKDYKMEDKWTFLVQGKALNVPVSPYYDNIEAIVCKNKLIEGGMGIHFYKNASFGGDWILQAKLKNAPWLNALLPENAPLSTMRVITTSTFTINEKFISASRIKAENSDESGADVAGDSSANHDETTAKEVIRPESAVLRLGRMNASTDHSSILFDVDIKTGRQH